ncbi:MAG: chemotaxis protein CheW [Hydrogenophilales bacterium]|jgi:two-component system chemotaxis sensor kinase CheA|nr:chemotaxis protein CheW [Hydrogenophilales bacterium]MBP8902125.1 chemotaxis protein CheW [Thiobacillaceae bacterium]
MSIDMSQFFQVFFEETSEHLANMENLLLNLDVDTPSLEDLNAIFRAAHSIKGGSGTFGFTDMTGVTHVLEGLLDRLRKEELALRPEMVDAFLAAGDILRAQLEHHQGGPEADAGGIEEIRDRLTRLAAGDAAPSAPAPAPSGARARVLDLVCLFPPDLADSGEAVANFLAGLAEIAALDIRHRPDAANGLLEARLTTSLSDAELRDALAFYLAPEDISLAPATDREDAAYGLFDDAPENTAPAEDEGYGFFTDVEPARADPGYGFFHQELGASAPPLATESGDGAFGLFEDAPGAPESPAHQEISPAGGPVAVEGQGYGLFPDAPGAGGPARQSPPEPDKQATAPGASPGRRLSDKPGIEIARSGRRDNDKTVAASGSDTSIRVAVEKVDQLINLVGELVITQAMLAETAGGLDPIAAEKLLAGIELLSRNTRDLQESVMSIRMLPMSMVFSRFPRVVRDLAGKLNKQVEMRTLGENTELDKGLIEKITDPLTHLVRNSLDHGIETPDKRVAAGKNPKGTLTLKASHQGGAVVIEVMDDGGGLNRARILEKARERGLAVNDAMSDHEVWQLIFAPGFSTADVVTDVSGRGVGMDVVKRNIEGLGGKVELESSPGFGTRTVIRLPLTLAILDGMSVGVGGETFIVPITTVVESLQPSLDDIRTLAGDSRMIHIRGEYLPFIALAEVFGLPGVEDITRGLVVVVEGEEGRAALFVDELLGQHQVVIKSLEANYRKVPGMSGATIMGDGRVALILDVAAAIRLGLASGRRRAAA